MKIRIEIDGSVTEPEVTIRCGRVDDSISKLQQYILRETRPDKNITFFKQNQEFFFPIEDVLFFETEGEHIYAHTASDAYRIKFRLYELEALLPKDFVRASKSAIVNVRKILSITRSLTSSSPVRFVGSHKQVFASRYYYSQLKQRLNPGVAHIPTAD